MGRPAKVLFIFCRPAIFMSWFLACPLAHLLYSLRSVQQKSQAASFKNTRQKILRPQGKKEERKKENKPLRGFI
jgi:hypothetical protein